MISSRFPLLNRIISAPAKKLPKQEVWRIFAKQMNPHKKITEVPKADGFASLRQTEETVAKVAATKAEATATQLAKFDAIDQKFGAASPFQHSATYNATADFYKQQRTDREVDLSR